MLYIVVDIPICVQTMTINQATIFGINKVTKIHKHQKNCISYLFCRLVAMFLWYQMDDQI